jgi:hypothetical protein
MADLVVILIEKVEVFRGSVFPQPKTNGFEDAQKTYLPGRAEIDRGNVAGHEAKFCMPAKTENGEFSVEYALCLMLTYARYRRHH